jgi:cytochrome b561
MSSDSKKAVDIATRVGATATRTRYDGVSIALHWVTAALIIGLFGLALVWEDFSRPVRTQLIGLHLTLGILLTVTLVWRIAWRLTPGHQVQAAVTGWTERASKAVQALLYVLLAGQVVLGFVARWTAGRPMLFFGLEIPSPLPKVPHPVTDQLEQVHNWVAWTIVILALGHGAAALFHHFVLRDEVLVRMLPRGRKGGPATKG